MKHCSVSYGDVLAISFTNYRADDTGMKSHCRPYNNPSFGLFVVLVQHWRGGGGRSPISGLGESMGVSYETLLLIPFSVGFLDFRKLLLKKIQEIILIADVETRVVLRETNRLDPAESSRRTNH